MPRSPSMIVRGPLMLCAAIIVERNPDIAGIAQWMRFIVPPERACTPRSARMASGDAEGIDTLRRVEAEHARAGGRSAERPDHRRCVENVLVEIRRCARAQANHHLDAD